MRKHRGRNVYMKKKIFAAMLTAAMGISLLAGCGGGNGQGAGKDGGSGGTPSTEENGSSGEDNGNVGASGETAHIVMTYLTVGVTPPDLLKVQDAVNEISVPEIGVEVEFKAVAIPDTFSNYSMWIGSGEQIDLMCIAFQGLNNYVNSGQLQPIDELLANEGAYLKGLADEFPITDGAVIQGQTYGIQSVAPMYGFRGGAVVREDYFAETGIAMKDQYTWEELTDILMKIKEAYPDTYPVCQLGTGLGSAATNYGFMSELDNLGATSASGSLLSADSTTIENVYATEGYKEYLLLMRQWQEDGLIMPDAATTDATLSELMASGKTCANLMNLQPVQLMTEGAYGWKGVALNVTEGYYPAISGASGTFWTIPVTSADPSAAMRFLNLMYENQAISDLLLRGIEGTHYVKTDNEYIIAFPEGVTPDNTGYYNPLGLFGDRRYAKEFSEGASLEENQAWTANNEKKPYQSVGYNYDTANMTNQLIAVNTVLDQYLPSLETGSVEDVEGTYAEFLKALETAGINEIIADNQAQFDAWRRAQ